VPLLLRAIRKSRWNKTNCPWLPVGDIQADPLGDLATGSNTLSVWLVQDDRSNLNDVLLALGASRDTASNLDYTIFDIDLLVNINIKLETNEGKTPYAKANCWHRDLVELTANKIVKLAESLLKNAELERFSEKEMIKLIQDAVNNKQIDRTKLKPSIDKRLV
jgi:hypothetical protein